MSFEPSSGSARSAPATSWGVSDADLLGDLHSLSATIKKESDKGIEYQQWQEKVFRLLDNASKAVTGYGKFFLFIYLFS